MKPIRVFVVASILFQLCGCSLGPTPELVYSHDAPDLDTPADDPVPELREGDDAVVTLRNGDRFEAEYRGVDDDILGFEDVEWKNPPGREPDAALQCALEDVAEIRRDDWGTADNIAAAASVAGLIVILAFYGRGDGVE